MNDSPSTATALRTSWRRLLIIGVIIVIAGAALYVFTRPKPLPKGSTFYSSDVFATNIQQPQTTSKGVSFFTGSNEALLDTTGYKSSSKSLFNEVPYDQVQDTSYDESSNTLLVSLNYSGPSATFSLGDKTQPGIYWLTTTSNGSPKVLNPSFNQTIDASINQGVIYGLTVEDNATYNLYMYTVSSSVTKVIAKGIKSNRVVGSTKNRVITQDTSGTVYVYDETGKELRSIESPGTVVFDPATSNLVTSNNDVSRRGYQLSVYSIDGVKKRTRPSSYKYIYVSDGHIFAVDDTSRPAHIAIYHQSDLSGKEHPLNMDNNPSKDALSSVVVVKQNPLVIGLVGSSNILSLASSSKSYIDTIPAFGYPYFSQTQVGGTTIQATNGSSDVTLITGNLSDLSESIADLKSSCSCDTNQLNKNWQSANQYNTEQYE